MAASSETKSLRFDEPHSISDLLSPSQPQPLSLADSAERLEHESQPTFFEAPDDVFGFCEILSPETLASALQPEDPLSIAILLSEVNREQAARTLTCFDIDWRMAIVRRMANLEPGSVATRKAIADRVRGRLQDLDEQPASGGFQCVAEILSALDSPTRQTLLDCLAISDLTLARRLSRQCLSLKDLLRCTDQQVREFLGQCDMRYLPLALVDAETNIQRKLYQNMAPPAAKMLRQAVEDARRHTDATRRDAVRHVLKALARVRHPSEQAA